MLKKITVEEAVMLIIKKETGRLYVKQKYSGDFCHSFSHVRDTNISLKQVHAQEFWLMTDDE